MLRGCRVTSRQEINVAGRRRNIAELGDEANEKDLYNRW